jgi:hypothetical protein
VWRGGKTNKQLTEEAHLLQKASGACPEEPVDALMALDAALYWSIALGVSVWITCGDAPPVPDV